MSIELHSMQYGNVLGEWKIQKKLYEAAESNTFVFLVTKQGVKLEERCALKAVNVITRYGQWDSLDNSIKNEYLEYRDELCENAEHEVELMYKLRGCSNIVTYYDYSFADWREDEKFGCDLLIRMELLSTLAQKMRNNFSFSSDEIIHVGKDISMALMHCQKHQILHRDIKPSNIFVNGQGDYLLGDFGISKILKLGLEANTAKGTLEYVAPEQFFSRDKNSFYEHRADIYSLGLILYELGNGGKLPFAKGRIIRESEIVRRLKGENIPLPVGVSREFGDVILKACSYDAKNRYQTAQELYDALIDVEGCCLCKSDDSNTEFDPYATLAVFSQQTAENIIGSTQQENHENIRGDMQHDFAMGQKDEYNFQELLEYAEKTHDMELEYLVGKAYSRGDIVEGNLIKAIEWFRKSAEQGYDKAQCSLGISYLIGNGVDINNQEALKWLNVAAEQGNLEAMWRIGRYYIGTNRNHNYGVAASWFLKAAISGHNASVNGLIDCLLTYAKKYSLENGYFIDDSGCQAIESYLNEKWKEKRTLAFDDIENYINIAISHVPKGKLTLLYDVIAKKRFLDGNLIILTVEDFD